jgi:hypothetical protein
MTTSWRGASSQLRVTSWGTAAVMAAPPRLWWEMGFDRLVDRLDEPEPIGLESPQHGRLVGQINPGRSL